MKIVVLTSETSANVWLVNQLLARHEVVGIVIERRPLALTKEEKHRRRQQMLQKHGFAKAFNKLVYNWVRSRYLLRTESAVLREGFFPGGALVEYSQQVPSLVVGSINDATCIGFIQRLAPDVLAVCGTTVIRPEVFTLAPKGAVNMHTGITPEYRSAAPIFWALYRGEPEKVGVTIHFVDRGIDTGAVIHQEAIPVYADDSLATISMRIIRRGAELFCQALSEIEAGTLQTLVRRGAVSKSNYSIDLGILQYLIFHWRWRRMAERLPRQDSLKPVESPGSPPEVKN